MKYLFVNGTGRSGTSILAMLLSSHEQIVIGVERYKALWARDRDFLLAPELFSREQFFNFSDGYTNIIPSKSAKVKNHYQKMWSKFDDAVYVGDKLTRVKPAEICEVFPDARIVIIVRNIDDVAASWNARASRKRKTWPSRKDAKVAVKVWSDDLRRVMRSMDAYRRNVCVVEYTAFFEDRDAAILSRIMDFLDLETDEAILQAHRLAQQHYFDKVKHKPRMITDEQRSFIHDNADHAAWAQLIERAATG